MEIYPVDSVIHPSLKPSGPDSCREDGKMTIRGYPLIQHQIISVKLQYMTGCEEN